MPGGQRRAMEAQAESDPGFGRANAVILGLGPESPMCALDERRLGQMDAAGVDVQVISIAPPGVSFGEAGGAAEAAAVCNDALIEAAGRFPGRFGVLASLPYPHPDECRAELERVAGQPLVCGVELVASSSGWTLDDPAFDPVYELAAQADLPVVVHPGLEKLPDGYADWALAASVAPMVSSSVAALRLIMSGTLDRVPGLTPIVPHLGGTILYLAARIREQSGAGGARHELDHYLRERLLYDSCSYHPPALRCAVETVGADRIMLGTDYPFRGEIGVGVKDLNEADLPAADREAMLGGTASRWFAPERLASGAEVRR